MKRIALITLVLLVGIFINSSFAMEVTLYGPEKYIKTGHRPTVYTDSFTISGLSGPGKLIISNHGKKWWQRIRFAKIWLNGKKIAGPHNFKGFPKFLEIPVELQETNEIKVKLWGVRGKRLSIEAKKEVEADAAAVCGPMGCEFEGGGFRLKVSPGALDKKELISITDPKEIPQLPHYINDYYKTFELSPTGLKFIKPFILEIHFDLNISNESNFVQVLLYDENKKIWDDLGVLAYNHDDSIIRVESDHFSPGVVGSSEIDFSETVKTDPEFDRYIDRFPTGQHDLTCKGITIYTTWYFRTFANEENHLKEDYSGCPIFYLDDLAIYSQDRLKGDYGFITYLAHSRSYVAKKLWQGLKNDKTPQLLNMQGPGYAHIMAIYKYDHDDQNPPNYYFYVQDPNWASVEKKIEVINGEIQDYEEYHHYRFEDWKSSTNMKMEDVYNEFPPACGRVTVQHYFPDDYFLEVYTDENKTLNVFDISGPKIESFEDSHTLVTLIQRPDIGDAYEINISYTDGSTEHFFYTVDGINDNFAEILSPQFGETIDTTTPTFRWEEPSDISYYVLHVREDIPDGEYLWSVNLSPGTSSVVYNFDGNASSELVSGGQYALYLHAFDDKGHSASTGAIFTVNLNGITTVGDDRMTVDGNPGDWSGINPIIVDDTGDSTSPISGTDIEDIYLAKDSENLYIAWNLEDGSPNEDCWYQLTWVINGDMDSRFDTSLRYLCYSPDCSSGVWAAEFRKALNGVYSTVYFDTSEVGGNFVEGQFSLNTLSTNGLNIEAENLAIRGHVFYGLDSSEPDNTEWIDLN